MPALFGALEHLGGTRLLVDDVTTERITVAPRDLLLILYHLVGFGTAADRLALEFNNDLGSNYQASFIAGSIAATPVLTNIAALGGTGIRLGMANRLTGSVGCLMISNPATAEKVVKALVFDVGAAVGTQATHELGGGGAWFNTTEPITTIHMAANTAGVILAGSGFVVLGTDL